MLRREGGKISLTVLFTIIAISIGGIGVAAMGSAVGLPAAALAFVLGSVGFGIGQEIDTVVAASTDTQGQEAVDESEVRDADATASKLNSTAEQQVNTAAVLQILQAFDEAFTPMFSSVANIEGLVSDTRELAKRSSNLAKDGQQAFSQLNKELCAKLEHLIQVVALQSGRDTATWEKQAKFNRILLGFATTTLVVSVATVAILIYMHP